MVQVSGVTSEPVGLTEDIAQGSALGLLTTMDNRPNWKEIINEIGDELRGILTKFSVIKQVLPLQMI